MVEKELAKGRKGKRTALVEHPGEIHRNQKQGDARDLAAKRVGFVGKEGQGRGSEAEKALKALKAADAAEASGCAPCGKSAATFRPRPFADLLERPFGQSHCANSGRNDGAQLSQLVRFAVESGRNRVQFR